LYARYIEERTQDEGPRIKASRSDTPLSACSSLILHCSSWVSDRADAAGGGTELTVIESGFDRIPAHRRAEAFRANSQGWAKQVERIARYVAQ
jgi:malate/lactate dehydrogenase